MKSKTLIIAEAGVNHNGDIRIAKELVNAAVDAGADIVKFQTFVANQLVTKHAEQADYQKRALKEETSQLKMLGSLEFDYEQHIDLFNYCKHKKIEFLSTAFDLPSIDLLSSLNLSTWKIPSGEITNLPYLRKIAALKCPILLSTGMSNLGDIEAAIDVFELAGLNREQITVLHCTTEYPAPVDEVNLKAIQTIARAFNVSVGYSDHTDGIIIPIAAVAMGATVIEKHLTMDKNMIGPDHRASINPDEFSEMVKGIRLIDNAMGSGIKQATRSEVKNLPIVRKSIVASRPINKGELLSEDNMTTKRPATGSSPMLWDAMVGGVAKQDYKTDEQIL